MPRIPPPGRIREARDGQNIAHIRGAMTGLAIALQPTKSFTVRQRR
jgi:hypothetical protein